MLDAPVKPGARFGASVSAHGYRLADARVTLRKPSSGSFDAMADHLLRIDDFVEALRIDV
jgi:putative hemolysin